MNVGTSFPREGTRVDELYLNIINFKIREKIVLIIVKTWKIVTRFVIGRK